MSISDPENSSTGTIKGRFQKTQDQIWSITSQD